MRSCKQALIIHLISFLMTAVERQPKLEAIDTSVSSFTGNVGDTKGLMRRRFLSAQTSAGVNDLITRYALMIRNIQSVLVQLITDIFITLTIKVNFNSLFVHCKDPCKAQQYCIF